AAAGTRPGEGAGPPPLRRTTRGQSPRAAAQNPPTPCGRRATPDTRTSTPIPCPRLSPATVIRPRAINAVPPALLPSSAIGADPVRVAAWSMLGCCTGDVGVGAPAKAYRFVRGAG